MQREFTVDDEGKPVVTADGERVGTVHRVSADRIHMIPAQEVAGRVQRRLGWTGAETEICELDRDAVASVTDDEVRLQLIS